MHWSAVFLLLSTFLVEGIALPWLQTRRIGDVSSLLRVVQHVVVGTGGLRVHLNKTNQVSPVPVFACVADSFIR